MSRHRFVRTMNLASETGFDPLSDGGEDENEEITPEQLAQMNSVREHIRAVIGAPKKSGITDKEIDDASWDYYFDLDQTMDHILDLQGKRNAAKERQESQAMEEQTTEPPLSALQKLSLARKAQPRGSLSSLAKTAQQKSPFVSEPKIIESPAKISKLSALARSASTTPSAASRPQSKLSMLAARGPISPVLKVPTNTVSQSTSKLTQKINANRAAALIRTPEFPSNTYSPPKWSLDVKSSPQPLKANSPSSFGSILTNAITIKAIHLTEKHSDGNSVQKSASGFDFGTPSPDDIILAARPAKEKERQSKLIGSVAPQPKKTIAPKKKATQSIISGSSTPARNLDQMDMDMLALRLNDEHEGKLEKDTEEPPKMTLAREKVMEEARKLVNGQDGEKPNISLVVIGHVDAGKSTLMGRLLFELGKIEQKKRAATERASEKLGKGSFSWAWELDSGEEERQRGITIDIAQSNLPLPSKTLTILDAPGHKDFVPNMISGATQADCALLVVDATTGEFETGFERGGQTREHLTLVRSLGVQQLIVAVNKLDSVGWDESRYQEIVETLTAFLTQSGFQASKTAFVPVSAFQGVNLVERNNAESQTLDKWYTGPTLVDLLDKLEPPKRLLDAPLRFPITNVFRGQSATAAGLAVSGRIFSGVVQVGERLRVVPGDESGVVKAIEQDGEIVPWAAAGSNVNIYFSGIDPVHLSVGSVLCPPHAIVPMVSSFTAQLLIFDVPIPLIAGSSVELFHHSQNYPATINPKSIVDRTTGVVLKSNPRVLTKGVTAVVEISLRTATISDMASGNSARIAMETFKDNKNMGRVLLRRNGETVAAGVVISLNI